MHLNRYPERQPVPSPTAVAIGNFDGLHLGHRAVIAAMRDLASQNGLAATVLTFEPHPRFFFAPHTPPFRLEPLHRKLRRLKEAGIAQVVIPRFNAAFAALTPQQFLDEVLGRQLKAKAVVTGDNFVFGARRAGSVADLNAWGRAHGVAVTTVNPVVMEDGAVCSSSAVRRLVGEGQMPRAQALLGRLYSITGRVVHGDQRGHDLGFPTANIALPPAVKLPATGVYAVRATVHAAYGSKTHDAVANFGFRPTVSHVTVPRLEVHLFDSHGDLYGARLEVHFYAHLREEKRFETLAALTAQIAADCVDAKSVLKGKP